jgi:hypothetical protein
MIMNKPYFEVGETVILESDTQPEYNGEYVVGDIRAKDEHLSILMLEGRLPAVAVSDFYYDLGVTFISVLKNEIDYVGQRFLRKKHKPSTESFHELITNTIKETT